LDDIRPDLYTGDGIYSGVLEKKYQEGRESVLTIDMIGVKWLICIAVSQPLPQGERKGIIDTVDELTRG